MGSTVSAQRLQRMKSRDIDEQILSDKKDRARTIKILLLGTSESGKSTVLKQMRILHMNGFDKFYRGQCKALIHINIMTAVKQLIDACVQLNIQLTDHKLKVHIKKFLLYVSANKFGEQELKPELGYAIRQIWSSPIIQQCYQRRHEFLLLDSAKYFLDNVEIISSLDYDPTQDDILRSRISTTSIVQVDFPYRNVLLKIVDVGGHRSEMKKWDHCFDDVQAVLFLVALSEYNQMTDDEGNENRLLRSRKILKNLAENPCFSQTSFIIFFNKRDIFDEKIEKVPLTACFPEFEGGRSAHLAKLFIHDKFSEVLPDRAVFSHFTVATDTKNLDRVFENCMDVIMEHSLASSCLS